MIKYIVIALLLLIELPCTAQSCIAWDSKFGSPIDFLLKKEVTGFIIYQWLDDSSSMPQEKFSLGYASQDTAKKNLKKVESDPYYFVEVCLENKTMRIFMADEAGNPVPKEIISRGLQRWQQ
jgi:hypothetical protein